MFDLDRSGEITWLEFLTAIYEGDEKQGAYYKQLQLQDTLMRQIRLMTNSKYDTVEEMLKQIESKVENEIDLEDFYKFI